MPTRADDPVPRPSSTFDLACTRVETALRGETRAEILAGDASSAGIREALEQLRSHMRSHVWTAGAREIDLGRIVDRYDRQTRREGFHVLHDWDGTADRVNPDIIPVDVLDYVLEQRGDDADRIVPAILLDYYFMHVLALLSLRVWDEGDADANLDRVDRLLQDLQGPGGSGQQFVADAATLLLVATSHYEMHERGFVTLLDKVRTLGQVHRTRIALGHASSMGSHLRFGFEATYARDTMVMRDDNVADYPWLCFALTALMREYARLHDDGSQGAVREAIVEGLVNGLSPDARAFIGEPPPSLVSCEDERAEFRTLFARYRDELLAEFERYRPRDAAYSPIAFFFNFSHNVIKGTVVDALLRGEPWDLTLDDLLTARPLPEGKADRREQLATTLMGYARSSPDRIRGRLMPVIVYDPMAGRRAFTVASTKLRQ